MGNRSVAGAIFAFTDSIPGARVGEAYQTLSFTNQAQPGTYCVQWMVVVVVAALVLCTCHICTCMLFGTQPQFVVNKPHTPTLSVSP